MAEKAIKIVIRDGDSAGSGRETLAYLERANLFLVQLDDERRWWNCSTYWMRVKSGRSSW